MHDGCNGRLKNGAQIVDKQRLMMSSRYALPFPVESSCQGCQKPFRMQAMEGLCSNCGMAYGVPPATPVNRAASRWLESITEYQINQLLA